MKITSITLMLLLFCYSLYSQDNNSKYYTAFDSIVGIENTKLLNGIQFIDNFRSTENNHRFFKTYQFLNGSVTYDSQLYPNIKIKYDIHADQVILELPDEKNFFHLNINTDKISQFTIDNHVFINYTNTPSLQALDIKGFMEPIFQGKKTALFIKHYKNRKELIKNNKLEHIFKLKNQYVYQKDNNFYILKSKNKLKKVFIEQAENIDAFYKNNAILLKRNPSNFTLKLFQMIDTQNQ